MSTPPPVPEYGAPASLKPTHLLTPEQVAFYQANGYLAIDTVMPELEIAEVRRIYDRLFNEDRELAGADTYDLSGQKGRGGKEAIPQILQPAKYAPALLATQMVANLKAMMQQLHGLETKMVGDHAINKPPHNAAATPWHQDEAYWNPAKEYSSLSVWVPLQSATKENGCMHFVPGSHQLEIVPHQPIGDNPLTPGLEVVPGAFDFSSAVACELPAGGATFHHGRTLHYTPPNNSDDFRRAYIAMGSAYEKPLATPRSFPWQERQREAKAKKPAQN
ncbi:MAG: phytanoyl-CoA dioxygenase family protein [Cephaloticoccus sp.]|nr:phytanoyl-CoA dioxygenase family protein [Cephaloticoccus sp.]MCF7760445.1 phytanoyl-CoA dioxygenase family protein [Cephaloticoccus sp.]